MPELYRADHVGSLLRPPELKEARSASKDRPGQVARSKTTPSSGPFIVQAGANVDNGEFRRTGFQNDLIESGWVKSRPISPPSSGSGRVREDLELAGDQAG